MRSKKNYYEKLMCCSYLEAFLILFVGMTITFLMLSDVFRPVDETLYEWRPRVGALIIITSILIEIRFRHQWDLLVADKNELDAIPVIKKHKKFRYLLEFITAGMTIGASIVWAYGDLFLV